MKHFHKHHITFEKLTHSIGRSFLGKVTECCTIGSAMMHYLWLNSKGQAASRYHDSPRDSSSLPFPEIDIE